jgi:hypothetical protein
VRRKLKLVALVFFAATLGHGLIAQAHQGEALAGPAAMGSYGNGYLLDGVVTLTGIVESRRPVAQAYHCAINPLYQGDSGVFLGTMGGRILA